NTGVLVKKGLLSGHVHSSGDSNSGGNTVRASMELVLREPGVGSMIVGTINPAHLRSNVENARLALNPR
ncbi:MAG TPA: aldo/keto reductase, partial [Pseudomonadaceae bacterium]|nr:aldo/keto reductase [Pseudomonadaceae bacterium]